MKEGWTTGQPESIQEILKGLGIAAPWIESRGRKPKYFFHTMKPGEIITRPVSLQKGRTIQTSMKNAANRQGIKITIQNKGTFLKIKRIK